jgi:hypothetical protein
MLLSSNRFLCIVVKLKGFESCKVQADSETFFNEKIDF